MIKVLINKKKKQYMELKRNLKNPNTKHILILYLIALIMAEYLTAYVNKSWGLNLHILILVALLLNSILVNSQNVTYLLQSLMVVPTIRIIGLFLPILQINPILWLPIIAIPIFISCIVIMRNQKLSLKDVGLSWGRLIWNGINLGGISIQLIIGFTGVLTGIWEYFILRPDPLIQQFTPTLIIGTGLILLISAGLAEELLFRGIIQRNAINATSTVFALIYVSLLFTTMNIGWLSIPDLLFVFILGIGYGYCVIKTKSIFGVSLAHGLTNVLLFVVMPFWMI